MPKAPRVHGFLQRGEPTSRAPIEKELKSIAESLASLHEKKRRIIDVYASGDLSRDAYVEKNREYDGVIEALRDRSKELAGSPELRRKTGAIDAAIAQYCGAARVQFAQRTDFAAGDSSSWTTLKRLCT